MCKYAHEGYKKWALSQCGSSEKYPGRELTPELSLGK